MTETGIEERATTKDVEMRKEDEGTIVIEIETGIEIEATIRIAVRLISRESKERFRD